MDIWISVVGGPARRVSGEVYKLNKLGIQESELWIGSFNQPEGKEGTGRQKNKVKKNEYKKIES